MPTARTPRTITCVDFMQVRCAMEAHTVPYAEELLAWWAKGRGTVSRSNSTLPRSESTRSGPFVD
jgi:hypothetical protein